jgi:hypothetical protein
MVTGANAIEEVKKIFWILARQTTSAASANNSPTAVFPPSGV